MSEGFAAINLGNLSGMTDPLSLVPLFIVVALFIVVLVKKCKFSTGPDIKEHISHKIVSALLVILIIASLSFRSTLPVNKPHCFNAHILRIALRKGILKNGVEPLIYEEQLCKKQ